MTFDPAITSRYLIRSLDRATLASKMKDSDGEPYASLVMVACGQDASPLVYLSDLAVHTHNLRADNRCSLLFDATHGLSDPLMGKRISVQGKAHIAGDDSYLLDRYIRRHPTAEMYKQFKDFNLFKIEITRIHLVAGFGRIHWIDCDDVISRMDDSAMLGRDENDILPHMNDSHLDAVNLFACKLANQKGVGWRMTGVDREGFDLRLGAAICRCAFPSPVNNADDARKAFIDLLRIARQ